LVNVDSIGEWRLVFARSTIDNPQSLIDNRQSSIDNPQSTILNRRFQSSTLNINRQSAIINP